jgi:hypothetical protein
MKLLHVLLILVLHAKSIPWIFRLLVSKKKNQSVSSLKSHTIYIFFLVFEQVCGYLGQGTCKIKWGFI